MLRERPEPGITPAMIEAALAPLRGRIRQRAPVYSALKQGGEPLYAKARRGEAIEAPEREVDVVALELLEHDGARLRLRVECGSGTYVRSLVRDLGESLGCGAHVATLRRLWVDPFREPVMFTLDELRERAAEGEAVLDACLLPIEAGLAPFPRVDVDAAQALRLGHGQRLRLDPPARPGDVAVFGPDGRALGLAELEADGRLQVRRLFAWASASPR